VDTCSQCGFEYDLGDAGSAGPALVTGAAHFAAFLDGADPADVRRRPRAEVWSPLEYACHVRDVLLVQRERVLAARRTDRPVFEPMGRDERVDHDGYGLQDPAAVARQMADAAAMFANVLARLDESDWDRTVVYGYPARAERTLRWVAVHTVHEMRHHLADASSHPHPHADVT
jgi:hypothetical protein